MKLVILSRDGVINQLSSDTITSADHCLPIDGSVEAIARLHKNGFTVVVATNQPGLALNEFDLDDLEGIHAKLTGLVEDAGGSIGAIFYCPHGPDDRCNCRKPKSGLIDAIEAEFDISAQGIPLVGDSLNDLQAGIGKGCLPILVKTGKGSEALDSLDKEPLTSLEALQSFDDLASAADYIIENCK